MYLSSSIVREMASMGGDVSRFVPDCVENALKQYFKEAY
jgi:pantetheine-phosphate adenylyltransferase